MPTGVLEYFDSHAPDPEDTGLWVRVKLSLHRSGYETMEQVCAAPVENLSRCRVMGEKSLAVALKARDRFLMERGAAQNSQENGEESA
jgi:DNA-directed RNA polymerase alpha subunit